MQLWERGTPLHASSSVLQISTVQTSPSHGAPSQASAEHIALIANTLFFCAGSRHKERGAPLHAASSVLQIPSVQTPPSHGLLGQAPSLPESYRPDDDSVFTAADWDNVLKGYQSQYVEHDFWVDASQVEGARLTQLKLS